MARNYSDLSPYDFEVLVRDLLQAEHGVRMETFPQGRDGGVDIRLHTDGTESIVVQCKHSPGKTYSHIKAQLESEAKKIAGRFTCRYILATSVSLTRENKKSIREMFVDTQLGESDILGVDDIENLLSRHPAVERANFKLWITSSAALDALLNSAAYTRSSALIDRIMRRRRIYVHNTALPIAERILRDHHVCIISGVPGIGKTTLAEMLLAMLISEGWQIHVASEDISDIQRVWNPLERQVFLYDDFLGQNSLIETLNKNEDSRLAHAVEQVRASTTKLLIMTTREYILRQASQTYEPLRRIPSLIKSKVVVDLAHYTREQKARILYNHLHFAELPPGSLESMLDGRRYRDIIDHPNFNPRIIELVTTNFIDSRLRGSEFYRYAAGALDSPKGLWEKIFESQLSDTEQNILIVLATVSREIEIGDLTSAVRAYEGSLYGVARSDGRRLRLALKQLQGTFITVKYGAGGQDQGRSVNSPAMMIKLSNPSFIDYISSHLASQGGQVAEIISGCAFFEQAETIFAWEVGISASELDSSSLWFLDLPSSGRVGSFPRLASGCQGRLMDAMLRLLNEPSCYWRGSGGLSSLERRPISVLDRYLMMLRLDFKYGRSLLGETLPTAILQELKRGDLRALWKVISTVLQLLGYLAEYQSVRSEVLDFRDTLVEGLANSDFLEEPRDFQRLNAFFAELDSTSRSGTVEQALRRDLVEFISLWDYEEAGCSNGISECEAAISQVSDVLADFGLVGSVETPGLYDRIQMLQDDFTKESEIFDLEDELEDRRPGLVERPSSPHVAVRKVVPADPVDDLFATLRSRGPQEGR